MGLLGRISQVRLKSVFKVWDPLVLAAAVLLLGRKLMDSAERWCTNVDIAARFVVALLDLEVCKAKTLLLVRRMVWDNLTEGIEDILVVARLGVGLPRLWDLHRAFMPEVRVRWYLFLLDVKRQKLVKHRRRARCGLIFLKHHFYFELDEGVNWRGLFRAYLDVEGIVPAD